MSEEYITKAEFDAKFDALKIMYETASKRIDDLKDEIAEARSSIVRGWTIVGVIAALGAAAVAVIQLYLSMKGVI